MNPRSLISDSALGATAGIIATGAMDLVTTRIYQAQSEATKQRENRASHGVAYHVAARKAARALGADLNETQLTRAGAAIHYALGISAAPTYMLLRRSASLGPWAAGLATGLGIFGIVDEGLNPLLGLTSPPRAYPLVTHLRGLAGHLLLGLAAATTIEVGWALQRRRRG
jgi:hypothetical protein